VKNIPGIKITQKVEVNSVFASLSMEKIKMIQKKFYFHIFNEARSEVRWMCSFNTTKKDIIDFVEAIKEAFN
jgi:threonine aldolase